MPAALDLTGQRFGKLIAIKKAETIKGERTKWICQCDCGNIVTVNTSDLRSGHSKSCGCLKGNKKNLIGQKFGLLKVLAEVPNKRSAEGQVYWTCQCDCGNIIEVKTSHLTTGNTTSCGCVRIEKIKLQNAKKRKDIANQKFGLLTALFPVGSNNNKSIVWRCQCDCGNTTDVSVHDLTSGNTKSCGCLKVSYGEYIIEKLLKENNIPYEKEKSFTDCKFQNTDALARFDFFVNSTYLIEYDGIQHFKQGNGVFDNEIKFNQTKERDNYKNNWCQKNNIPLIRIPYTHKDIILDDLLLDKTKWRFL